MDEVALLDKVLLKLALAKDDAELEGLIQVYLCPVLLKAGTIIGEQPFCIPNS